MIKIIAIVLIVIGIVLILRSIYFTYEINELLEILIDSELGTLSNEFIDFPKKLYGSGTIGKNYSFGDITKSLIINVKYKLKNNKTIESQVIICEFDYMYANFFRFTFDLFTNRSKKKKKYLFFELIKQGKYRAYINKDCLFIPFNFGHENFKHFTFYFENALLFTKFKEQLLKNYRLNKNIGKSITIENNVDKILSNADEIEIEKTGNI